MEFKELEKQYKEICDDKYVKSFPGIIQSLYNRCKDSFEWMVFDGMRQVARSDIFNNVFCFDGFLFGDEDYLSALVDMIIERVNFECDLRLLYLADGEIYVSIKEYMHDKYALVIKDGMLNFVVDISIVSILFEREIRQGDSRLDVIESYGHQIAKLLAEYCDSGEYGKSYFIDKIDKLDFYDVLKLLVYVKKMLIFLAAHELMHIYHLHSGVDSLQEDEADISALFISRIKSYTGLESIDKMVNDSSSMVIPIFFFFYSVVDSDGDAGHEKSIDRGLRLMDVSYNEYGTVQYSLLMMRSLALLGGMMLQPEFSEIFRQYFLDRFGVHFSDGHVLVPERLTIKRYEKSAFLKEKDSFQYFIEKIDGERRSDQKYNNVFDSIRRDILVGIYLVMKKRCDEGIALLESAYGRSKEHLSLKLMYFAAIYLNTMNVICSEKFQTKQWLEMFNIEMYMECSSMRVDDILAYSHGVYANKGTVRMSFLCEKFYVPELTSDYEIAEYIYSAILGKDPETLSLSVTFPEGLFN